MNDKGIVDIHRIPLYYEVGNVVGRKGRISVKRSLIAAIILLLVVACLAEGGDLITIAQSRGLEVEYAASDSGARRCDLTLAGDGAAAMAWTDGRQLYTVTGAFAALSRLYLDALAMGGWETCRYTSDGSVQFSFGADSVHRCDSLGDYASQLEAGFDLITFANSLTGFTRSYVLNKHSKKFHYPDCSGIRDMNPKNREDYTGTRDEVLAMGYSPCGICKP